MAVTLGCAIQASLNHGSLLKEYDTESEVFRQHFRQFQYHQASGPREAFNNLWELCSQWLKPAVHSKEEILEQLVFEQFLNILPMEIKTWVRLYRPENREKVLSLIEELQKELEVPVQQVKTQEIVLKDEAPVEIPYILPDIKLELPEFHVPEPFPEFPLAEIQDLDCDDFKEYPLFSEPICVVPNFDLNLPFEHREEPEMKELQTSKERNQSLYSENVRVVPNFDLNLPFEHREEPEMKELQTSKERNQSLYSENVRVVPNFDLNLPFEHREEPEMKELQTSKERNQSLYSENDFDIKRENEDYSSNQNNLENASSFFAFEENILHGPTFKNTDDRFENQQEIFPVELQRDPPKLLDD